jgi:RNA polymerase primary sigma factor
MEKYDFQRGWRFGTYAHWWIRQFMIRAIQDQGRTIRIPVHMLETAAKVQRTAEALRAQSGREPKHEDIAAVLEVETQVVRRAARAAVDVVPFDEALELMDDEQDDAPTSFAEVAADTAAESPLSAVLYADLRRHLQHLLRQLRPREGQVLNLRFGLTGGYPQTLEQVGQHFGVTRERIRQIEAKAIRRLRRKLLKYRIENLEP